MRISINLAKRPFADLGPILHRLRVAMGVLALAAVLMALGLHAIQHKADIARAQDRAVEAKIAGVRKERQDFMAMMRQPENAKVLAQAGRLNQLFDEKAFSWTLAIEDLETVLPGGIQVTTLEPNRAPNGAITLKLRVTGPRDHAIEMVQNLEHSQHFSAPRIVGESAEASGGSNQRLMPVSASNRVSFDVLADYIPPTLAAVTQGKKKPGARDSESVPDNANPAGASEAAESTPSEAGERRMPYLGMPRPKAPVQKHKGVAK